MFFFPSRALVVSAEKQTNKQTHRTGHRTETIFFNLQICTGAKLLAVYREKTMPLSSVSIRINLNC